MRNALFLSTALSACSFLSTAALANPDGGVVAAGSATIESSASRVDVQQSSDRAVIDWRSFNIQPGETTQFHQPNSGSLTVNRINDTNPSLIQGNLSANGNIVLINQSGIAFGKDSKVDVNSLVATTSNITNADAMAGNLNFQAPGSPTSAIINEGTITARDAGLVGLVAPHVENKGVINAKLGKVHMASGDRFSVDLYGDGALMVAASDDLQDQLVSNSGTINADGGEVRLTAASGAKLVNSLVELDGEINAPSVAEKNGRIVISGNDDTSVSITGRISADGNTGGDVSIYGKNVMQQGTVTANGASGKGGTVSIGYKSAYFDSEASKTEARGHGGTGGKISVKGAAASRAFVSGHYDVSSTTHNGGSVQITADQGDLKLFGAHLSADGDTGGGTIQVGGEYQGGGSLAHAATTSVNYSTVLSADALTTGTGGQVVVWSDNQTKFAGTAQARGGVQGGDGGVLEISSKDTLTISSASVTTASARAEGFSAGTLLLDPKNITIATGGISGGVSYFELVDPNPDSGTFAQFGAYMVLDNGNVVVIDSYDDLVATDAGAAYLFNGATGALISTVTGGRANDLIGVNFGLNALTNGNYIIRSTDWDNGGVSNVGAVTWGSKTTGISGVINTSNSLVGAYAGQGFGLIYTMLTNGNYVISDPFYNNGAAAQAGAVAWGSGTGGTVGVLSAANALVGSTSNDRIGANSITALPNGNYVVLSPYWDNGGITDAGAVTLGNGNGGTVGPISSMNSLVGTQSGDLVGYDSLKVFSNGSFVVGSSLWDNGGITDAGAITFFDGTTAVTGPVSSLNSLVGSSTGDSVGESIGSNYNIIELTNGHFVVAAPHWDNGGITDAGAIIMGSTTTGFSGTISAANALVGSSNGDLLGADFGSLYYMGLTALPNGNFLVISPYWDNGGVTDAGAVTWVDGTTGLTGTVDSLNSLVGTTAGDMVGSSGVLVLANSNYIIGSQHWSNAGAADAGASTWANGATGITGAVSIANSLVGAVANDHVGIQSTALASGNYVVISSDWNDGANAQAGAVTYASGTSGITGLVTSANSLIGANAYDFVGSGGVYSVGANNFVVISPSWDNGASVDVGAVTWLQESGGTQGTVTTANSLYGSTDYDMIGSNGIAHLPSGNYIIMSPNWDNGAAADAGAITWANGNAGITGPISAANSLVGGTTNDYVGMGSDSVIVLQNGNFVVLTPYWDRGAVTDAGAVTWGNGNTGVFGLISSANSVVGSQNSDQVGWSDWGASTALSNGDYALHAIYWDDGASVNAGAVMIIDGTYGTTGDITSYNAVFNSNANGFYQIGGNEDHVNHRYVIGDGAAQKVYSIDLSHKYLSDYDSFGDFASGDITLSPDFITHVLNNGTSVTLQASNDITLNNAVTASNPTGNGGTLTLQAGRSILLNANITTDNGDLNLLANEKLSAGVVDAQRDAGNAVITMANGTSINAGTGAVTIRLDDGAGKTNSGAGDITLRDITAGSVFAQNKSTSGDVVLESGSIQTSQAGNAITIVSGRNFINHSGAGALNATSGAWLVYSTSPSSDVLNGLSSNFRRFSCTYGGSCPTLGTGNGFLYTTTPLLTVTPDAIAALTYGDAAPSLTNYGYSVSGYLGGDAADDHLSGILNGSTTYSAGSNAGTYDISYLNGSLSSDMGYGFTYGDNLLGISVGKKAISASFTSGLVKTYGDANPTVDYTNFTFSGLYPSDNSSVFTTITPNFGPVTADTDIGSYAISAHIADTTNYSFAADPSSTLLINARPLSIVTNAASKTLPAADPVFTGLNNLTAHDAALVSWGYAPVAYGGLAGSYTIAATATDPLNRLNNYTRTNSYGIFTVLPGAGLPPPAVPTSPSSEPLPNTVNYMSLGGVLLDLQTTSRTNTAERAASAAPDARIANNAPPISIESQLAIPVSDTDELATPPSDSWPIWIHPTLKRFLSDPFAILAN